MLQIPNPHFQRRNEHPAETASKSDRCRWEKDEQPTGAPMLQSDNCTLTAQKSIHRRQSAYSAVPIPQAPPFRSQDFFAAFCGCQLGFCGLLHYFAGGNFFSPSPQRHHRRQSTCAARLGVEHIANDQRSALRTLKVRTAAAWPRPLGRAIRHRPRFAAGASARCGRDRRCPRR